MIATWLLVILAYGAGITTVEMGPNQKSCTQAADKIAVIAETSKVGVTAFCVVRNPDAR